MANIIQIKRSTSTAVPSGLEDGELAYSFLGTSNSLFIGDPQSSDSVRIGGGDFEFIYDTQEGVLQASKALVTNASSYIDEIKVGTLTIDETSIASVSTTIGSGSATVLPTTSAVKTYADTIAATAYSNAVSYADTEIATAYANATSYADAAAATAYTNATSYSDTAAATAYSNAVSYTNTRESAITTAYQSYADSAAQTAADAAEAAAIQYAANVASQATLVLAGDAGTNTSIDLTSNTLSILGGTGLTSTITNDTATIDLDNTTVVSGSYGSSTSIPTFTVDAQGRLTAAGSAAISTTLSTAGDTGTGSIVLGTDNLNITGDDAGVSVDVDASGNVVISADHDLLTNFEANEHINHSAVSITAGVGLAGGGNITATRTLAVSAQNGLVANTSGLFVGEGSGITTTSTTVGVNAGDGITTSSNNELIVSIPGTSGQLEFNPSGQLVLPQALGTTDDVEFESVTANTISINQIISPALTVTGTLNVTGDLDVAGTLSQSDSSVVDLGDSIITLLANTTPNTAPILDAGLVINRGTEANAIFQWDEGNDYWTTGTDADVGGLFVGGTLSAADVAITGGTITGITDLAVADGGTGRSSFAINSVLIGDGTNAIDTVSSTTEGHVLQIDATGTPTFSNIDGGIF